MKDDASGLFGDYPESVLVKFKKFHKSNPHVYEAFKDYAQRMMQTGRRSYSARTIIEVIRWDHDLKTTGDVFQINGDFVPIYVRLLIYNYPQFAEFFELRRVRSRGVGSEEQKLREAAKLQT